MRHILGALSIAVVLAVAPTLAAPLARGAGQSLDDIVEKHLAALGGRAALGKLTSRQSTGTITVTTPNGDLSGTVEISFRAPNRTYARMELDLTAMGMADKMIVEQKFNGTAGWSLNSLQGDAEITGNQLDNLRNNTFPSALLAYKAAGLALARQPNETIDGKEAIVLVLTPKTGSVIRLYLDAATHLVFQSAAKVSSPQMGEFEQVSQLSDYRIVDGVKVPFQVVNTNPAQVTTIKLTKVVHNVALDDALFNVKTGVSWRPAR
jgi:hypothetical protein